MSLCGDRHRGSASAPSRGASVLAPPSAVAGPHAHVVQVWGAPRAADGTRRTNPRAVCVGQFQTDRRSSRKSHPFKGTRAGQLFQYIFGNTLQASRDTVATCATSNRTILSHMLHLAASQVPTYVSRSQTHRTRSPSDPNNIPHVSVPPVLPPCPHMIPPPACSPWTMSPSAHRPPGRPRVAQTARRPAIKVVVAAAAAAAVAAVGRPASGGSLLPTPLPYLPIPPPIPPHTVWHRAGAATLLYGSWCDHCCCCCRGGIRCCPLRPLRVPPYCPCICPIMRICCICCICICSSASASASAPRRWGWPARI